MRRSLIRSQRVAGGMFLLRASRRSWPLWWTTILFEIMYNVNYFHLLVVNTYCQFKKQTGVCGHQCLGSGSFPANPDPDVQKISILIRKIQIYEKVCKNCQYGSWFWFLKCSFGSATKPASLIQKNTKILKLQFKNNLLLEWGVFLSHPCTHTHTHTNGKF